MRGMNGLHWPDAVTHTLTNHHADWPGGFTKKESLVAEILFLCYHGYNNSKDMGLLRINFAWTQHKKIQINQMQRFILSQFRGRYMLIEIDFNSDEAIYIQLRNQIILGIATSMFQEGDSLPSVRQLAETIGVNMHTVNKAYAVLKQEGFISLDKRRGAVICVDIDKIKALEEMREQLRLVLAKGCCKNITREEVHALVDDLFDTYSGMI